VAKLAPKEADITPDRPRPRRKAGKRA
jgi:hypothetical protein